MEAQRAEEDFLEEEDPASVRRSSSRTPTPTPPTIPLGAYLRSDEPARTLGRLQIATDGAAHRHDGCPLSLVYGKAGDAAQPTDGGRNAPTMQGRNSTAPTLHADRTTDNTSHRPQEAHRQRVEAGAT